MDTMEKMGLDNIPENVMEEPQAEAAPEKVDAKPRPFVTWAVKGRELKLKLTTDAIVRIERAVKKPLLDAVFDDGLPRMEVFIAVIQGALAKYEHGFNAKKVADLIDSYLEDHNQLELTNAAVYPLLYDAGFFTESGWQEMQETMKDPESKM